MLGVLVGKYYWILFFCSSRKYLLLATSKATEYRELSILVWSGVTMPGYWFFQTPTTCYNMSWISKYFGKNSLWTYGNSQLNFFLFLISPPDENSVKSSCKLIPLPSVIKFAFVSASAWANVFACVAHVQVALISISSDGKRVQAFRIAVSQILYQTSYYIPAAWIV